jgi:imidazole glycerol phosphate synthase subunit HisF
VLTAGKADAALIASRYTTTYTIDIKAYLGEHGVKTRRYW